MAGCLTENFLRKFSLILASSMGLLASEWGLVHKARMPIFWAENCFYIAFAVMATFFCIQKRARDGCCYLTTGFWRVGAPTLIIPTDEYER